jgi:prepilin-type N-terminal cleavage/methylation domain-containing protein
MIPLFYSRQRFNGGRFFSRQAKSGKVPVTEGYGFLTLPLPKTDTGFVTVTGLKWQVVRDEIAFFMPGECNSIFLNECLVEPPKDMDLSVKHGISYRFRNVSHGVPVPCTDYRAFTLVELMVAVSILACGIALVVRSFAAVAAALDNCDNRVAAVRFLENKMEEAELQEREEGGICESEERNTIQLGNRTAEYIRRAALLEVNGQDDADAFIEDTLTVSWKEGNKEKNAVLAAYFKQKKTD